MYFLLLTSQSDEAPPAKKKKKPAALQVGPGPDCLVYLTGIPKDATEQEVINLAGSFGPINNVLLLPGSDEEEENGLQVNDFCSEEDMTCMNRCCPNVIVYIISSLSGYFCLVSFMYSLENTMPLICPPSFFLVFPGVCLYDQARGCPGVCQLSNPLDQRPCDHCFCSQGKK